MYYVLQIRNNLTTKHKKINVFYYKNHLDPFFISVSIFKYGFENLRDSIDTAESDSSVF